MSPNGAASQSATKDTRVTVNIASANQVKVAAVARALQALFRDTQFDIRPCAVELQDDAALGINAQPHGLDQSTDYATRRLDAMANEFGKADINIAIESGAIDGLKGLYDATDVAVVVVNTRLGRRTFTSVPVHFPVLQDASGVDQYPLVIAQARGFVHTTGGDIIHEFRPDIPNNDWQQFVISRDGVTLTRSEQIASALTNNADALAHVIGPVLDSPTPRRVSEPPTIG